MHLAFIMDWNRRWAKNKWFPKFFWHKKGVEWVEKLLEFLPKYWVDTATIYALSTENMSREKDELDWLFKLFILFAINKKIFEKNEIKFKHIWKREWLPQNVLNALDEITDFTKTFTKLNFQMWINYWWKDEIIRSFKKIIKNWEEITEKNIEENLDTFWVKNLDMIIRTWWHKRLSNFLMWQSAYCELYFTDKMWPEFDENELKKSLDFLDSQQKNFWK